MRIAITIVLFLCVGVTGCSPEAPEAPAAPAAPAAPEAPAAPMKFPTAAFIVTYRAPVRTVFTSSVTQNWSKAEGRPLRYRATMMQSPLNGRPASPGRVQWEFAGTVAEGDVYVVRIHPDMSSTNATILPIVYSGAPLEVLDNEILEIRLLDTRGADQVLEDGGTGVPNSQH